MNIQTYVSHLQSKFEAAENPGKAGPMKAYMKNHFDFLGISSPERKNLLSEFLKEYGLPEYEELEEMVTILWGLPYREFQYCAMEIINKRKRLLQPDFIQPLEMMILTKSWWDTVDFLAANIAGHFLKMYNEFVPERTNKWSNNSNMWLNRSAILFQLKYRKETNTDLLVRYILPHTESREFFIQKAIGWALRQYSKTDAKWVVKFISSHTLAPLSIREGLK